jgi:hypothetical protein
MPRFTIKVALHGADFDSVAYDALHQAMQMQGFSRSITLKEILSGLPSAEYSRSGDSLTGPQVLRDAQAAGNDVWEDFSVAVTQADKPAVQWNVKKIK